MIEKLLISKIISRKSVFLSPFFSDELYILKQERQRIVFDKIELKIWMKKDERENEKWIEKSVRMRIAS
jgi:hypothetical protein